MWIRTAFSLLLLLPAAAASQELGKALSAVVRISGMRGDTPVRGSGFVVGLGREKATIITASHVIDGAQKLEVTFGVDLAKNFNAEFVFGMDSGNPRGLEILQVRGTLPTGVTSLSLDTETQLQRLEELSLLGFPQLTMEPLALRRTFAGPAGSILQLDGPVGEGFSGAPVLRKGKVVGVVTEEDLQFTYAINAKVAQNTLRAWCEPGEVRTVNRIDYVRICPGTFTMGSAEDDPLAYADEKPAHEVALSKEFWIGKTEVTNKQYRRFRPNHQGEDDLPATGVSWNDAKAACESFGGRLPTEAEWEYAARAGSKTAWSFGSDEPLANYAWYGRNASDKLHPVATRKPNDWGLYDMHGNVWEWVADWYAPYEKGPQTDPAGPRTGQQRVWRGGAFFNSPGYLRSALRFRVVPEFRGRIMGFRCVQSPRRQP